MTDLSNYSDRDQKIIRSGLARGDTVIYLGECEVTGMSRYFTVNFF